MPKSFKLTQSQIYTIALLVGMPQPKVMAAIAMAESGGNIFAHNANASTGDNSYGLWQINMLGSMGPARRREFGISRNEELFDPIVNARAAKKILASQGLGAWSVYRSGAYARYLSTPVRNEAPNIKSGATQANWWDDLKELFGLPEWEDFERGYELGQGAGDAVLDVISVPGLEGVTEGIKATADVLVNPRTWLRVAYGVTGAVLVVGGLFLMVRNTAVDQTVGKVAKSITKGAK